MYKKVYKSIFCEANIEVYGTIVQQLMMCETICYRCCEKIYTFIYRDVQQYVHVMNKNLAIVEFLQLLIGSKPVECETQSIINSNTVCS